MLRRLIRKYQAYRDRKFLERLNRVLANNVLKSDVVTLRDMLKYVGGDEAVYVEDFREMKFPKITKSGDKYCIEL